MLQLSRGEVTASRRIDAARPPTGAGAELGGGRSETAVSARTAVRARRETAPQERAEHAEAIDRGELLPLLGGASPVVHRDLEDPLPPLHQPGRDLRLDGEARGAQRKALEDVGPNHLVAGHDVVQVHVVEQVAGERDALVSEYEEERVAGVPVERPNPKARVRSTVHERWHEQRKVAWVIFEVGVEDRGVVT